MQAQFIALTTPPSSLVLHHHQYNGVKMTVGGYTTHKRVQKRQPAGVKPSKKRRTNSRPRPENTHTGRWTKEEHAKFLDGIKLYGKEWKKIASMIETRTVVQIRTHAQKYFQKLAKKKLLESGGRSAASSAALKSVAAKKKGSRRKSSSRSSASSSSKPSPLLSLLLPTGGARVKPAQESPTSVTDLNFHFPKLGPQTGTYPDSASNLFSCDLPESPDVPLTNWLDDVSVRNDSDSSDCCTFLELGQKTIYADTSADKWDDPWDFDPDAFVTGSLLGDSL